MAASGQVNAPELRWLLGPPPRTTDPLLFCFPYAGGGASTFRGWRDAAGPDLDVVAVQLPGRENRLREPAAENLDSLISVLQPALAPWLDRPYALFGHSMGALIAFELARAVRRQNLPAPVHLFVSARGAPDRPPAKSPIHSLPDMAFVEEIRALNGTPDAVLQHPELMAVVLPTLRADFAVVETYQYRVEEPLDVPITVFAAENDDIPRDGLEAWRAQTTSRFRLQLFAGGHFFVQQARDALLQAIRADLGL